MSHRDLEIDTTSCVHVDSGTLRNEQPYDVVHLNSAHIPPILKLQEIVESSLPDSQKTFIFPKTRSFFQTHFEKTNPVIGVISNGTLIAQSIIRYPTAERPDTGMGEMRPVDTPNKVSVIQGMLVHPDARGQKIAHTMTKSWIDLVKQADRTHLLAKATADNSSSWAVFLDSGMHIVSMEADPRDKSAVYNMHTNVEQITHNFNQLTGLESPDKIIPMQDIHSIESALGDGLIGHAWDRNGGKPLVHFSHGDKFALPSTELRAEEKSSLNFFKLARG